MKLKKAIQNLCLLDDKTFNLGYGFAEDYILILSSSSNHEIKDMIVYVLENYYMECPFWAKIIAFRILINNSSNDKEIIELLRQRSRPYLFSNSLAPSIVGASIEVLNMLSETTELRDKLESNTKYFREKMTAAGFDIKPGVHPIVPVMLYDAKLSQDFAARMLEEGIYVIGFFYPVVPKDQARIRVQLSAGHDFDHIDKAIAAFTKVGKELGVIA